MIQHPPLSVLAVAEDNTALLPFFSCLQSISHVKLTVTPQVPADLGPYQVVITASDRAARAAAQNLQQFVSAGNGWLNFIFSPEEKVPELFGAQPRAAGPAAELRVLFQDRKHPLSARLPDAFYVQSPHIPLEIKHDDAETLLYADWHYQHSAVLVKRRVGSGQAACTTLQAFDNPVFQQILYRLLRDLAGQSLPGKDVGVGILGYAPSVGRLHGQGIAATPGLSLNAICDISQERLSCCARGFPRRARAQGRGRAGAGSRRAARHHRHCAEFPCAAVPADDGRGQARGLRETACAEHERDRCHGGDGYTEAAAFELPPEPAL